MYVLSGAFNVRQDGPESEKSAIQIFDLSNQTAETKENVIDRGQRDNIEGYAHTLALPVIYISSNELRFFGGYKLSMDSMEQHIKLDSIEESTRVSLNETVFKGLTEYGNPEVMRFTSYIK